MFTVNRNPTDRDLRAFGRAMLIGFGALAVIAWIIGWRRVGGTFFDWTGSRAQLTAVAFLAVGVALFLLSLVSLKRTRGVYVAWMSITVPIGIAMSALLLSIMFLIVLPLFSIIVRIANPLRKRLGESSYWENYPKHPPTLDRLRRPF